MAEATGGRLIYEAKKSLDPVSVIAIAAGVFVLGEITKGFFSKLGQDGYETLKAGLKKLLGRRKNGETEKLLMFEFVVRKDEHTFHVELVATNPSAQQIDDILTKHLSELDALLPHAFDVPGWFGQARLRGERA